LPAWSLDGKPLLGVSVFAVVDVPLEHLLGQRFATFRMVHLPTAADLTSAWSELPSTGLRPHFTLRLHRSDEAELRRLLVALGPERDNPQSGARAIWPRRADVYQVDIRADLNDEDDAGYLWTFLDEAAEPARIVPGALVVAGDEDAAAVC